MSTKARDLKVQGDGPVATFVRNERDLDRVLLAGGIAESSGRELLVLYRKPAEPFWMSMAVLRGIPIPPSAIGQLGELEDRVTSLLELLSVPARQVPIEGGAHAATKRCRTENVSVVI
jgi:hypothetical protein